MIEDLEGEEYDFSLEIYLLTKGYKKFLCVAKSLNP
jgi:hypothetical protein